MRNQHSSAARSGWRCALFIFALGIALLGTAQAFAQRTHGAQPVIAAYVFPQDRVLQPGQVDADRLTRVNYAFANIQDGRMIEGFAHDGANLKVLTGLRQKNPSLTVLVSVGGWLWSGGFSDMALTPASRAAFIESAVAYIARYNLDGLDIDWEYPAIAGAKGHRFRPQDTQNYTALLRELRARFNREEKHLHRHLYITIAVGSSSNFIAHTEMSKVQRYVDTVNLMAYDYYEPSDGLTTGNHAPLHTDPADPKAISADRSVREFEKAGVPASKLVLGVPFYGHVWGDVPSTSHGLFQPGKPVPNAFANYGAIVSTMLGHGYERYWDSASSVPYLYNAQKKIFVSYEDPQSLSIKGRYILNHHLAGVMFWEYTNDPSGTLLQSLNVALRGETKK